MTDQLDLFDSATAPVREGKLATPGAVAAMGKAYRNAAPDWKELARVAVIAVTTERDLFTTDDVWEWLEETWPGVTTHEPAAMGPVVRSALRDGLCEKTAEMVASRRPHHHGEIRVYRSLSRSAA